MLYSVRVQLLMASCSLSSPRSRRPRSHTPVHWEGSHHLLRAGYTPGSPSELAYSPLSTGSRVCLHSNLTPRSTLLSSPAGGAAITYNNPLGNQWALTSRPTMVRSTTPTWWTTPYWIAQTDSADTHTHTHTHTLTLTRTHTHTHTHKKKKQSFSLPW